MAGTGHRLSHHMKTQRNVISNMLTTAASLGYNPVSSDRSGKSNQQIKCSLVTCIVTRKHGMLLDPVEGVATSVKHAEGR